MPFLYSSQAGQSQTGGQVPALPYMGLGRYRTGDIKASALPRPRQSAHPPPIPKDLQIDSSLVLRTTLFSKPSPSVTFSGKPVGCCGCAEQQRPSLGVGVRCPPTAKLPPPPPPHGCVWQKTYLPRPVGAGGDCPVSSYHTASLRNARSGWGRKPAQARVCPGSWFGRLLPVRGWAGSWASLGSSLREESEAATFLQGTNSPWSAPALTFEGIRRMWGDFCKAHLAVKLKPGPEPRGD